MEVILEVRDVNGVVTWHALGDEPVTIGRALTNSVILTDPYADAQHVRIARSESGTLEIRDSGSVNGVYRDGKRVAEAVVVEPGVVVRIGRTMLAFRDKNGSVAPAVVDVQAEPPVWVRSHSFIPRSTRARWAIVLAMLAAYGFSFWTSNTDETARAFYLGEITAVAIATFIWAAIWAAVTRGRDRKFHFLAHLTVVSLGLLAMLLIFLAGDWFSFLFPGGNVRRIVSSALTLLILASLVAEHLSVAPSVPRTRAWRAGALAAVAMFAIGGITSLAGGDKFSTIPVFENSLKPIAASITPTQSVEEFSRDLADLKKDVDDALKKKQADSTSSQ